MKLEDIFERDEEMVESEYRMEVLMIVIPVAHHYHVKTSKGREFTCKISDDNLHKIRDKFPNGEYCTLAGIMELDFDSIKEGRHYPF